MHLKGVMVNPLTNPEGTTMADYWISFRVEFDSEASYNSRYNKLSKAIEECATGGLWETDTSFVCIRSKYGIDAVGQHLKKALNSTTDHLVLRRIDYLSTRYINEPGGGFEAFFPHAIKL